MNNENVLTRNKEIEEVFNLRFNMYLGVKRFFDIVCSFIGLLFVFLTKKTLFFKLYHNIN